MNLTDIFLNYDSSMKPAPGETISIELMRSQSYNEYFNLWRNSVKQKNDIEAIRVAYESILNNNSIHDFLELPTQSVFIYNNENNNLDSLHLHYLIDFFKEKMMQHGYRSYFSDLRISMFEEGISRKITRHYLKVSFNPTLENFATNSRFGNIYFEVVDENNHVMKMRIICNYLQQRKRKKEKSIHELIEYLLKE